jgi:hypothetical protein
MKPNFLKILVVLALSCNLHGCFKLNNLSCKPTVDIDFIKLLPATDSPILDLSVVTYTGESCILTFD